MWVRIDDRFDEHPKLFRCPDYNAAVSTMVALLCFCGRNETDGFVPATVAARFDPATIDALIECGDDGGPGLLERDADSNLWVHDFLNYNPSRAQNRERRAKGAERVERWRSTRNGVGNGVTNGVSNATRNTVRSPLPKRADRAADAEPDAFRAHEAPCNGVTNGVSNAAPVPDPLVVRESKSDSRTAREVEGDEDSTPAALSGFPPCLSVTSWSRAGNDSERVERTLAGHILATCESELGAAWSMKPTNVGKLAGWITAGCIDGCDGGRDQAFRCSDLIRDTIERKAAYAREQGTRPVGLIAHSLKEDGRL